MAIAVGACQAVPEPQPPMPEPWNARAVVASCEHPDRVWADAFRRMPSTNSAARLLDGYAELLGAMHEPSLWCGQAPDSFRLLWVHSFSSLPRYPPTAIRIARDQQGWYATATRLNPPIIGGVTRGGVRRLTAEETRQVFAALAEFDVWAPGDWAHTETHDGATWLVEAHLGTRYHPLVLVNADQTRVERLAVSLFELMDFDPSVVRARQDPRPPLLVPLDP